MKTIVSTGVLAGLCTLLSGCWVQAGFDSGRTNWNDGETGITSGNVSQLEALWDTTLPDPVTVQTPVSANGGVYVTAGGQVAGIDADDGDLRWTHVLDQQAGAGLPLWDKGAVHVTAHLGSAGGQFSFKDADGTVLGGGFGTEITTDLAVHDGRIVEQTGDIVPGIGYARVNWTFSPYVIFSFPGSSPGRYAFVGDRIMWSLGSQAAGYSAACPDYPPPAPPDTGCAPDWQYSLGGIPAGPAAIGDDQVVYTDSTGTVTVLDAATGALLWTAEAGATPLQRAAVADGTILVGTGDGRLLAYDASGCGGATCTATWEAALGGAVNTQPAVAGDVVYVAGGSDIHAFALGGCGAAACTPLKTLTVGSPITGGPIVDDGRVIAGTQAGHVMAWALPA
jgi:outer membrane protein assembly factor BamB